MVILFLFRPCFKFYVRFHKHYIRIAKTNNIGTMLWESDNLIAMEIRKKMAYLRNPFLLHIFFLSFLPPSLPTVILCLVILKLLDIQLIKRHSPHWRTSHLNGGGYIYKQLILVHVQCNMFFYGITNEGTIFWLWK